MKPLFLSSLLFGPSANEWLDFAILFGAFVLVAVGTLVWVLAIKKKRRRKRKHRTRHRQTLAETGGLPPVKDDIRPRSPSE